MCGVLVQYPATNGTVKDFSGLCDKVHAVKGKVVMASDLLACTILKPPGEMGADIVVGTNQVSKNHTHVAREGRIETQVFKKIAITHPEL